MRKAEGVVRVVKVRGEGAWVEGRGADAAGEEVDDFFARRRVWVGHYLWLFDWTLQDAGLWGRIHMSKGYVEKLEDWLIYLYGMIFMVNEMAVGTVIK
jgi:hypothetical protein